MLSKIISIISLTLAVLAVLFLYEKKWLLANNPISFVIQIAAVILMIWARITFGIRSFHAAANTTKGKLVTNGPYHFLRHPIYASLIYFFWASVIAYPFLQTVLAVSLITVCLFIRMILEEQFLLTAYDDYKIYSKQTKRIIPFVF
jgi:protein-S-isoprenylcysteine O-methyltransferase Ste14